MEGRALAALERRELPEVIPSMSWSLEHEEGPDDVIDPTFFARMERASAFEYAWQPWEHPPNRFPMAYSDVSMIAATYTIPVDQARELLPASDRLKLVRLTPRRAPITFFGFDYRKGGLGRYHEVGVALAVVLDRPAPPLLPALVDTVKRGAYPGLGNYAVQLPVNQARACEAGIRLYGLPKVVGESEFTIGETSGSVRLDHEGKRMASLTVSVPGAVRPRRIHLPFKTLTVLDGRIIETDYETIAVGHLRRSGDVDWCPGDHPRFARVAGLDLSHRPVEVRVIQRLNWIIWGPRDRGRL